MTGKLVFMLALAIVVLGIFATTVYLGMAFSSPYDAAKYAECNETARAVPPEGMPHGIPQETQAGGAGMKSKSCKAKGREFQQALRLDLMSRFGIHELDIQSTVMGQSGCDLYLSKAARTIFPFGVEAKNQETTDIWAWLKQAEINAKKESLRPLLVFRRNRSEPYAVLPWTEFLSIWNEVLALRDRVRELEAVQS